MSKIPLWVYNYELKRHEVFPHHLLTQNPNGNGEVGLYITWDDREKMAALLKYRQYFSDGIHNFQGIHVMSTGHPPQNTFYVFKLRKEPHE